MEASGRKSSNVLDYRDGAPLSHKVKSVIMDHYMKAMSGLDIITGGSFVRLVGQDNEFTRSVKATGEKMLSRKGTPEQKEREEVLQRYKSHREFIRAARAARTLKSQEK